MKDIPITENTRLVSFDIKDLYTSIPIKDTINILHNKLTKEFPPEYTDQLTYTTKPILKQNYFKFNGRTYKPQDGLGMGNPTSAYLSEAFLQHQEEIAIPKIMMKHGIKLYNRYVDDTFCILERDNAQDNLDVLDNFNKIHPNIKYTMEIETHISINFLDITITRENNTLTYNIYRKPTTTDTTIHASSNHPT